MSLRYAKVLTIAGSDSGGGAGIQADIKSISACGGYAASVITAITAQNTLGVSGVYPVELQGVSDQLEAVLSDIQPDAVKIGMLHSPEIMELVSNKLLKYKVKNIVLDPVMVATSGDKLMQDEGKETLINDLILKTASLITPNIPEAEMILGEKLSEESMQDAVKKLSFNNQVSVLLKGGHLEGPIMTDYFYNASTKELFSFSNTKVDTQNTHGTGCSLSSAIAAFLAKGNTLNESVEKGKEYINSAIEKGKFYSIGKGKGPVHHFFEFWE